MNNSTHFGVQIFDVFFFLFLSKGKFELFSEHLKKIFFFTLFYFQQIAHKWENLLRESNESEIK